MAPRIADPTRRTTLSGLAAVAAVSSASLPLAGPPARGADPLVLNDASRLNPTRVARHTRLDGPADKTVAALRRLLAEAAAEGRPVVMGGARHSMGAQSLCAGASAVTDAGFRLEPDPAGSRFLVSAGARWRAVVPALDRVGLSVPVMQSNSDFSVGGTLSVNGHGWAVPFGAFAASLRRFRLVLADGTLVSCSRDENAELFRAAIGGYGLLGIVVDVELDAMPNAALRPSLRVMRADELGPALAGAVRDASLRMAYGRLSVMPGDLLGEALLVTFAETTGPVTPLGSGDGTLFGLASRILLRAQSGSDLGKAARWWAETALAPRLAPATVTRNRLLAQPVTSLGSPAAGHTDILHEYFLPPGRLAEFLTCCREALPASGQDLLNVTLRYVAADPVSLLAFAPEPRVAAVMLFDQARTDTAEASMRRLTERLVDGALALGGSFYLPYRLHARRDQVRRAYPGLDAFLALKRRHDPAGRFRNALLDAYLA